MEIESMNEDSAEAIAEMVDAEQVLEHIKEMREKGWNYCPGQRCRKHFDGKKSLLSHTSQAHNTKFHLKCRFVYAALAGQVRSRECVACRNDLLELRKTSNTTVATWPRDCARDGSFWMCPTCASERGMNIGSRIR